MSELAITTFVETYMKDSTVYGIASTLDLMAEEIMKQGNFKEYTGAQFGFTHAMLQGNLGWMDEWGDVVVIPKHNIDTLKYYGGIDAPYTMVGKYAFFDGEELGDMVYFILNGEHNEEEE